MSNSPSRPACDRVGFAVVLSLSVLTASLPGMAEELRIEGIGFVPTGTLRLEYLSSETNYFVLERSDGVSGGFQPVQVSLGQPGRAAFTVTNLAGADAAFFVIRQQALASPLDLDGDGIDDVYELRHAPALHPLAYADASEDADGDGLSNFEEAQYGFDAAQASSPSPVEFSRAVAGPAVLAAVYDSGALGGGGHGARLQSPPPPPIPNLVRIHPEVSVNSWGVMAYIAELSTPEGGRAWQIYVARRLADGSWQHAPVLTDAQAAGAFLLGPGLQINDANTILVRRAIQQGTPLGTATLSFMEIWNGNVFDGGGRGQYMTVASAEPLNLFAEFSIIDNDSAYNNLGSSVFFAQGRSGRFIVSQSTGGAAKTPLGDTVPYTPLSVSDAETVVLRVGDSSGAIRLFGLPDIGNRHITVVAGGGNGFSSVGAHPGISADGRIVAFYGVYGGATNRNIGSTGPGIFALIHAQPITAQNVGGALLVRIAGLAGNGQLDPGEVWHDRNTNGVVELGEDEGTIAGFFPDQAVGASNAGIVTFSAQTTPTPGGAAALAGGGVGLMMQGPSPSLVALKLKTYQVPAPGTLTVFVSTAGTLSGALAADALNLHDPLAGGSAPFCAFAATASGSGQSLPMLAILAFPELQVTDTSTAADKVPYAANAPATDPQNKELCLRADRTTEKAHVLIDTPNLKDENLRTQLAWRMVELPAGTEVTTGDFQLPGPSIEITLEDGTKVMPEKYFEIQAGRTVSGVFTPEQRVRVRLVRDRLNWWFEPFSTDFGWRTARPEPRVDIGDYHFPQKTAFARESLQSIYEFLRQPAPALPATFFASPSWHGGEPKPGSWLKSVVSCFGEFNNALKIANKNSLVDLNAIPRLDLSSVVDLRGRDTLMRAHRFVTERQTAVTVDSSPFFQTDPKPERVRWAVTAANANGDAQLAWYDLLAWWQKEGSLKITDIEETGGVWMADAAWSAFHASPPASPDEARLLYAAEVAWVPFGSDAFFPNDGKDQDNYPNLSDYAAARSHFIALADSLCGAGSGVAALNSIQILQPTPGTYQVDFKEDFYVWMLRLTGRLILTRYWQPEGIAASYAAFNGGSGNVALMSASIAGTDYPERARLGFNNWAWHYEARDQEFAGPLNPPPPKRKGPGIRPNAVRFLFYRDVFKTLVTP